MLNHACRPNTEWYHEVLGRDDDVGRTSGSRLSTTTSNGRRVVPRDRRDALRPRRRPHRARRRGTTAMMIGENLVDGRVTMRSSQHHIQPADGRRERARARENPTLPAHARTPLSPRARDHPTLSARTRSPHSPRARENPTLSAHARSPFSPRARENATLSPRPRERHSLPAHAITPLSPRARPHTPTLPERCGGHALCGAASAHTHRDTHIAALTSRGLSHPSWLPPTQGADWAGCRALRTPGSRVVDRAEGSSCSM